MDIEFKTQEELYKRVLPALKSKKAELRRKGYNNIKEEDIWMFLAQEIFSKTTALTLSDIVSYIMHIDIERLEEYINTNFRRTGIYENKM